jgi:hypothetical protein
MRMTPNQVFRGKQMRMMVQVDILIPMHIAHCAQTDVCEGIKVATNNQRSI